MNFLFTVFIFPITVLMELILEKLIPATDSSIFSLILLSFIITLISLPFSVFAENLQQKERLMQQKMRPKIDEFKSVFRGAQLNRYLTALYRQNRYHPVFAVRSSLGLLIQIPFFFAAYEFISNYQPLNGVSALFFENLGQPDQLLKLGDISINIMPFVMTAANLTYVFVYGKKLSFKEKLNSYFISVLFLALLYNSSSALLIYWTANNLFGILKNLVLNYGKFSFPFAEKYEPEYTATFFLSLFSMCLLLFITVPFALLTSGSSSDIEGTFQSLTQIQTMLFTVSFVTLSTLFLCLPGHMRKVSAVLFSILFLFSISNVFLFAGDYGDITNFIFEDGITVSSVDNILNILVFILIILFVSILIYLKRTDFLNVVFSILLFSLIVISFYEGAVFYGKVEGNETPLSEKLEKKFVLSKNGKNVIVVMLDRFIGGYVPELAELIPELKNEILEGFVWYSNSLSSGTDTLSSEPSIMGGWDYHADTMNKTRKDVPLLDKMNESIRVLPYNFSSAGFDSAIYGYLSSWMKKDDLSYLENTIVDDLNGKYLDIWLKEKELIQKESEFPVKLAVFGLFRILPPFLRETIYDDGKWLITEKGLPADAGKLKKTRQKVRYDEEGNIIWTETNSGLILRYLKNYSTMDYLGELSSVTEENKGRFYYFSTKLTHEPWITGGDFEVSLDGTIKYSGALYRKYKKSMNSLKHIYTDGASLKLLGKWFKWMKENGVYDNTRIIIVSDHGRKVHNFLFDGHKIPGSKYQTSPALWHNLIMVKDFDSKGEMVRDSSFMTTCDIPYLAIKDIYKGKNPYTGNKIEEFKNKLPFTVLKTKFRIREQEKFKFSYTESFRIKDENIFKLSNWEKIDNL